MLSCRLMHQSISSTNQSAKMAIQLPSMQLINDPPQPPRRPPQNGSPKLCDAWFFSLLRWFQSNRPIWRGTSGGDFIWVTVQTVERKCGPPWMNGHSNDDWGINLVTGQSPALVCWMANRQLECCGSWRTNTAELSINWLNWLFNG